MDTLGIEIKKMDASGKTGAVLSGAQFTVKYYDGYYTKDNLPSKSDRTWVLETKAVTEQGKVSYKAYLDEKYKVSGGSFYTQDGACSAAAWNGDYRRNKAAKRLYS